MGLIDLKTDLKSLRYGKDTIGGGYSGQPYIQTPIPESFNDLGANEDFILRGGINAVRDSATDIRRLTKMFGDLKSPNGLLFIAKQNVLSNAAVRTQTSGIVNEGIYTPLNTLAQAGIVAFGGHLNKQGLNPFEETGAYANSEILYSVKVKPTQLIEENRLAELHRAIIKDRSIQNWNFSGIDLNVGPNILSYNGGPNSILGVGKTNIRFASQRTGNQNPQSVSNPTFFYTGSQKSVDIDDKQVGGLQINTDTKWTKAPLFELPDFNVNSPQSSSFAQANNRQYNIDSSTEKQNITGSTDGGKYEIYNPLLTGISKVNGIYDDRFSLATTEYQSRNIDGQRLESNNVYKSGSLDDNTKVTQGQKIQKSVDSDNESVGGLQVETGDGTKPWIKGGVYFDGNGKNLYFVNTSGSNGLPSKNINSPQSASLSDIPDASKSIAPQDINNPNGKTYSDQINDIGNYVYDGGATNKYKILTKDTSSELVIPSVVGNKFTPNGESNVYTQGNTFPVNSSAINDDGTYTYNQQDIIDQQNNVGKLSGGPSIQDFRKILRNSINFQKGLTKEEAEKLGNIVPLDYIDYSDKNIGVKNLIGNPGQRTGKDYSRFNAGQAAVALDKINAAAVGTDLSNNDLVQFRIKGIEGTNIQTLAFRAFLGSISDSYSSTLNTQQYVGRGENFYTYGGQSRKISLSWTVAALSREELLPMYKRLSYLASMTAPIYVNGFMQGPLVSLTIGGYIYDLPGYIEGFSLEMAEDSTWEIAINPSGSKDDTISQLTHVIKVSGFNFQPIPNYLPEVGARFISIVNPAGTQL
jgi:hypothetical protein